MNPVSTTPPYGIGHWVAVVTFVAGVTLLLMVLLRLKQLPRRTSGELLALSAILLAVAIGLAIALKMTPDP